MRPGFTPSAQQLLLIKTLLFTASLLPFGVLAWGAWHETLGANPIEAVTHQTGTWTFNFLLISLAVTPLRGLTGLNWLLRLRRMLGLFCFFYAALHFSTYLWLDQFFDVHGIARDIFKRPFITVGFLTFALLVPLAATSSNYAIRKLGGRRWQALHRSVYLAAILASIHYFWLVKITAIIYPLIYALILALLLAWRVRARMTSYSPPSARPAAHIQPIQLHRKKKD